MNEQMNSAYYRARRQQAKRLASIPAQLEQPALLTERDQPVRKPLLSLKRTRRTNEHPFTQVKQ